VLDPGGRFTVPALPEVFVFPDDGTEAGFYAIPARPRVATDESGRPALRLVLYGRRRDGRLALQGGLVTLTTTLRLTGEEERRLLEALTERLAAASPGGPTAEPPAPRLLSPGWVDGEVEVRLTRAVEARGTPSLLGANECALALGLDAPRAEALQAAWDAALPDGWLRYRVRLRAGRVERASASAAWTATVTGPGARASDARRLELGVRWAEATAPLELVLEGPLGLARAQLGACLSRVEV
jgi:hypothetical protein